MKKLIPFGILAMFPIVAMAQGTNLTNIVDTIGNLIAQITPIIVGLALLYFFWGLAKYVLSAGDEEKKTEGRNIMIWGIIALFVMVSVWGLVQVVASTLNVDTGGGSGTIPRVEL